MTESPCIKILVVGPYASGKSSLIDAFVGKQFQPIKSSTLEVDFSRFFVQSQGTNVEVLIYDTSPQTRGLHSGWFRGMHAVIVIEELIEVVQSVRGPQNPPPPSKAAAETLKPPTSAAARCSGSGGSTPNSGESSAREGSSESVPTPEGASAPPPPAFLPGSLGYMDRQRYQTLEPYLRLTRGCLGANVPIMLAVSKCDKYSEQPGFDATSPKTATEQAKANWDWALEPLRQQWGLSLVTFTSAITREGMPALVDCALEKAQIFKQELAVAPGTAPVVFGSSKTKLPDREQKRSFFGELKAKLKCS